MSRKSVMAVALAVVVLLAMVVPAFAAPEWTHGIEITAPTGAAPAYVPYKPFTVKYNVEIVGIYGNVDDVFVKAELLSKYGILHGWETDVLANQDLEEGTNAETLTFDNYWGPEGWYDLKVCVMDADWETYLFCDTEVSAVLLDGTAPKVWLDKPEHGAWVTGQKYLMVGGAKDEWALDETSPVFEYCAWSNWLTIEDGVNFWGKCGPNDNSWIWIADGKKSSVANEWYGDFDSSQVKDDIAVIRFGAADKAGNEAWAYSKVFVENRYEISLNPGWNLVSTPLMLYSPEIENVFLHQIAKGTLGAVATTVNPEDPAAWKMWKTGGAHDIAEFKHGQGYWVFMRGEDNVTFVGTWKDVGPVSPPSYAVKAGWNLIGYTHWGQPTAPGWSDKLVLDYLGLPMAPAMEALWRYDAGAEVFVPMWQGDAMVKGAGYWLAVAQPGTINP